MGGSLSTNKAAEAPGQAAQPYAASAPSTSQSSCPVPEQYRNSAVYNVYNQRIDGPEASTSAPSRQGILNRLAGYDTIDPSNQMPREPNQQPCPGQKKLISTQRLASSIPKGGTDGTWLYPSPQMFYNALKRKSKGDDVTEDDMNAVVHAHNSMNEMTWQHVLHWEQLHSEECPQPTLLRFRGRPDDLSPLARLAGWFGGELPFDRHDWYVDRCGKEVRYVIDFYFHDDKAGTPDAFSLRVRPAVDTPEAVLDRTKMAIYATFAKYIEDNDRFPGWKGELPQEAPTNKQALSQHSTGKTVGYGEMGREEWRGEVIEVSWRPRAFLFKNFLSDEECDHLINLARPSMTKSTVVDNVTGKSVDSTVRTSTGTFFGRGQDEVIDRIEKRIAHVSHVPAENGEGMQVLHYVDGQKYEPHHDFFHDKYNADPSNGGQRVATMLMYLTTVDEGGETVFPQAETRVSGPEWSDCAQQGLAVKTRRGDALLFFSLHPDGETDPASLHGSCATIRGEKWSATKWMHVAAFGLTAEQQKAKWGDCIDADARCSEWAGMGECEKNPGYMNSSCRLSCKRCAPKSPSMA
ncbi:hypothetical protein WJX72_001482 [[Myrmecia] bisecta]|uniref:Holocytochrome c-type synthase n=1 Tax=[Myrmecia] bisecta TaxID=41462 RepID=A0AAW1PBH7_9CHLO